MSVTEARQLYNSLRYDLYDVYARRDPADFLQKVIVYGQEAHEATTPEAQAQAAFNKMTPVLQITLTPPTASTTITEFTRQVNVRKSQWFAQYVSREPRRRKRQSGNRVRFAPRSISRPPLRETDTNRSVTSLVSAPPNRILDLSASI